MYNNLSLGSVVLLEDNELCILIICMKVSNIFRIGPLELIDRLIIISDGKNVRVFCIHREDAIDELHLGFIGILKFIDHDELVCFRETHTNNFMAFYERDRFENHIGKIYKSTFFEDDLIGFEDISKDELLLYFG